MARARGRVHPDARLLAHHPARHLILGICPPHQLLPDANAPADHLGRHHRLPPSGLCPIAKVRGALDGTADGPYLRGINLPRATLGADERVDVLGRLLFPRRLGDEI